MAQLREIPLELQAWGLAPGDAVLEDVLGRRCLRFADRGLAPLTPGIELGDGVIEIDLLVTRQRSFHGLRWRSNGDDAESFFVRPHQVGNPDAIQYTPVTNGVSSWQLYHGPGYWAPVDFPIGDWFTIRVQIAGQRADVYVGDLATPALAIGRLKLDARSGGIGIQVGGPGLHVARFAWSSDPGELIGIPDPEPVTRPGTIPAWEVSDAVPGGPLIVGLADLPPSITTARTWTRLPVEPGGLANPARVQGVVGTATPCSRGRSSTHRRRASGPSSSASATAPRSSSTAGRCSAATRRIGTVTTASSAASAGSTRCTCRSSRLATELVDRRVGGPRRLGHPGCFADGVP